MVKLPRLLKIVATVPAMEMEVIQKDPNLQNPMKLAQGL
jgi:hypothetical protein